MPLSLYRPAILAALISAAPAVADDCRSRASAVLEGRESVTFSGMTTTFAQRFVLLKETGAGVQGRWTGIEWEHVTTMPVAISPQGVAALQGAPDSIVPGVEAVCDTSVAGSHSVRLLCKGRYPFEIKGDGVYWVGRPERIGSVTPASAAGPARISLSIFPKSPMFTGIVTGPVIGAGKLTFRPEFTSRRVDPQLSSWTLHELKIALSPPVASAKGLDASVDYAGKTIGAGWSVSALPGAVLVKIRLSGSAKARAAAAGQTKIVARAQLNDCDYSTSWTLIDLMLALGVTP